ncbi:hypothetical protein Nepgr_019951 [Nepenthes gracilis]|uniref:Uncharacterized protein n=1 Tax=Nepenthes gracilis TaxID=150966 RepID=A0AAD3SUF9_NEPGR|nr:hypothetical protein Nepgr_019951 [Nepenthes gracilis]
MSCGARRRATDVPSAGGEGNDQRKLLEYPNSVRRPAITGASPPYGVRIWFDKSLVEDGSHEHLERASQELRPWLSCLPCLREPSWVDQEIWSYVLQAMFPQQCQRNWLHQVPLKCLVQRSELHERFLNSGWMLKALVEYLSSGIWFCLYFMVQLSGPVC